MVESVATRHVFRWDLDKTYLRSEFQTFKQLFRTAFERPQDKRAVPGAPALLKALKAAGGGAHRIAIISGSPRQMRRVLEAKLALDGVEWDEFELKPNLSNLVRGRFRALREQVGYKLPALLRSRIALAGTAGETETETLLGDDAESDAIIYSLYAELVAGRLTRPELVRVLDAARVYPDVRTATLALAEEAPRADIVQRILIHLDRRTPPLHFDRFGPRLIPIYNYFQAAIVLHSDGRLAAADVIRVAREMVASGEYDLASLANSLQDLLRRGRLALEVAMRLALECLEVRSRAPAQWADLPPNDQIAWAFATRVRALGTEPLPLAPSTLERPDFALLIERQMKVTGPGRC